jgi:hypothetical protein
MRIALLLSLLLLAAVAPRPAHADAALRAATGILEQRSADLEDRIDAARSIGRSCPVEGAPVLARALNDPHPAIREAAADALWTAALSDDAGAREAVAAVGDALRRALDDPSVEVAAIAASALEASGETREALADVRRDVLRARGGSPYARFIAARGLIGLDPPAALAPVLLDWGTALYADEASGRRGSIRDDLDLLDRALARLLRDGGPDAAQALAVEAGGASPVNLHLLTALAGSPPPGWLDLLLRTVDSPHAPSRERAWALLGARRAPDEAARWMPRAIAALDDPDTQAPALRALRESAGCCAQPLELLAAIALDPPSDAARLAAVEALARASDATSSEVDPAVLPVAKAAALRVFPPLLAARPRDDAFDAALGGLMFTERDDAARAEVLAAAIRANPDPAARIALIDRLSPSGTRGAAAVEAVKPHADSPDPATREAALRALSAIAPAWRESAQRAASGAARAVTPAPAGAPGVPLMKLFDAIRADDPAPLARLVTRANVNASTRMPDGTETGDAPLDAAVSHCGLPMMDAAKLQRVFRILLDAGADPERPGRDGDTPMTRAKYQCPPEVLALLAGG